MTRVSLLTLPLAWFAAAIAVAAAEPTADQTAIHTADRTVHRDLDVTLIGALFSGEKPTHDAMKDLVLYMGLAPDAPEDRKVRRQFLGWAGMRRDRGPEDDEGRRFNAMDHEGTVKDHRIDGETYTFDVEVQVRPDPWVPGGEARYRIELTRDGDRFTGRYTGTFRGQEVAGKATATLAEQPWPTPIADWQPLERGEHPRLMFRKADLPELRRRARTETGQAIIARLRLLLGNNGERFPEEHSSATSAYGGGGGVPLGGYTISHGAGYGLLYQLTGERKYADLARQAVELSFSGVRDRDQRYSWQQPGGKLRAGPSYAQIAYAYDLCYDAWPEEFRRKVAKALQDKIWNPDAPRGSKALAEPTGGDLVFNTQGGQHSPHSNHYGAWNGGGGVATLAILGDPGTDDAVTYRAHRVFMQRAERALEVGYGDSAFFFEGHHGGRLNLNTGLSEYILTMRNGAGLDYIEHFAGGDWLVTKWLYELTKDGGKIRDVNRGIYAGHGFSQGGWSSGGDFALGFGIAPEQHVPAILWFYHKLLEPEPLKTKRFDALMQPSRAAWALVNWPIDVEPVNPDQVLPRYLLDAKANYYVLRSGWSDDLNDWVAAAHYGQAKVRGPGYAGDGAFYRLSDRIEKAESLAEGDAVAIHEPDRVLVADMSGLSTAPIVMVAIPREPSEPDGPTAEQTAELPPALRRKIEATSRGVDPANDPERKKTEPRVANRKLMVGDRQWRITTVQAGPAPELEVVAAGDDAQTLRLGKRLITITFAPSGVELGEADD